MPRGKKNNSGDGHGLLAKIEAQYLTALRFSRDQLDRRIKALEESMGGAVAAVTGGRVGGRAKTSKAGKKTTKKTTKGKKAPRDYDLLKAKITRPMTIEELVKTTGKTATALRQSFGQYPGLFRSNGKRPATYTLDTSR